MAQWLKVIPLSGFFFVCPLAEDNQKNANGGEGIPDFCV
jgi:hypothetical protein